MANTPKERPSTLSPEEREELVREGQRLEKRRRRLEDFYAPHMAHIQAKSEAYYREQYLVNLPWWHRLLVKLHLLPLQIHEP